MREKTDNCNTMQGLSIERLFVLKNGHKLHRDCAVYGTIWVL